MMLLYVLIKHCSKNGYENIDRNMFFSLKKDSRTRGHEVKLVKDNFDIFTEDN